jgi:hypothetical protein
MTTAPTLDHCRHCGGRVRDFDSDGYERPDGQRGHQTCDQAAADDLTGAAVSVRTAYAFGDWPPEPS